MTKPRTLAATLLAGTFLLAFSHAPAAAQNVAEPTGDNALLNLPLEELLTLESTSVAKKRQRVTDSAAAVYVITQEDIRHSAARTIPDLLRRVPGVEVGEQQNGGYAVSIRGFNSRLTNSLLVMVDGRSIYVSTLSGTFWDQLMIPLHDIERIEVVRGPGATLWGANAVNGVINIITKHSAASIGTVADVRVGTRNLDASLSQSGRISDALGYRVYGSYRHSDGPVGANGQDLSRRWEGGTVGARLDWEPDDHNAYTLQGEYQEGSFDVPFAFVNQNPLTPGYVDVQTEDGFKNFNVLSRWTRKVGDDLDWTLQASFDRVDRREFSVAHLIWNQASVDMGVRWKASEHHELNFGIGGRLMQDRLEGSTSFVYFLKPKNTDRWLSGYVQDDISLIPDRLRLTLGTKLEYNNFTGFEYQPSARIFFKTAKGASLWAGISRAVRTPSRFERDAVMSVTVDLPGTPTNPFPLPLYSVIRGDANRQPERLIAYEAGVRLPLPGDWSVDVAGYYNNYDKLTYAAFVGATPVIAPPIPFPVGITADLLLTGGAAAETWGLETAIKGSIKPWWKVQLTHSWFDYRVAPDALTGIAPDLLFSLDGSPRHQIGLHNEFDIGDKASISTQLRYVDKILGGAVPSYFAGDVRVTYHVSDGVDLSLVGENLLDARHAEFSQQFYQTPVVSVPRTISAQLRVRM